MRTPQVGGLVLAMGLMAVVGAPTLATIREVWREAGPLDGAGEVARPLGLAFESARLVVATEAIALPFGVALAFLLFRTDLWGRRALLGLLAVSVFVPMPLDAAAWIGALGNLGRSQVIGGAPILVGWPGAAFVHAMAALPWVVLLAGVGLRSVEPELEESALLDLPGWRVAWQVTLRRAVGAIAGGALAVAVLTAGDMTVTDLLQVRTYAEVAYTSYAEGKGPGTVAAVALPPLVVLGAAVLLAARALLRADPARLPSPRDRPRTWRLGAGRIAIGVPVAMVVGGTFALPIYGLAWRAGRVGGSAALGIGPRWSLAGLAGTLRDAASEVLGPPDFLLETSALWAGLGASAAVILAWPLAWSGRRPGVWRWIAASTVALTLATPGPVAGMGLVLAYRNVPDVYDTPAILVLAYTLRVLPYTLLVLWPAVRGVPDSYLDAATVEGHGPWGRAWNVALPLTRGATIAAWGVAFVLALGELPASHPVEPPGTTTMAKVLWSLLHTGVESHLAGVGLVMLTPFALVGALVCLAVGRTYGRA